VCAETWGDNSGAFLNAAVKFAQEFEHWGGFGAEAEGVNMAYPAQQG
jgi:hypothetical protein